MYPGSPYPIRQRLLVLLCLLLPGCETAVDAFTEDTAAHAFYVFGYLDTARDTQFVRVEPVRRSPAPPAEAAPLDATVTSEDLETGAVVAWQDSLVRLDDGRPGHLFYAVFTAAPAHRYHLTVRRTDGAVTGALTLVPSRPNVRFGPVQLLGTDQVVSITQSVLWEGVPVLPQDAYVRYRVAPSPEDPPAEVAIPYQQRGQLSAAGWDVTVRLLQDQVTVREQLQLPPNDPTAAFYGVSMDIALPSSEWQLPAGVSNVENGGGFFGSVGRFTVSWTLSDTVVSALRYTNRQDAAGAGAPP